MCSAYASLTLVIYVMDMFLWLCGMYVVDMLHWLWSDVVDGASQASWFMLWICFTDFMVHL